MKRFAIGLSLGLMLLGSALSLRAQEAGGYDFEAAAAYSAANSGEAVVVMQAGEIVFEEYQNGYDAATPHLLASGTKSFTCALAVAAIDDGLLTGFDELVVDTLTEFADDPLRSQITVRQLLSLSAGIDNPSELQPGPRIALTDTYAVSLDAPPLAEPGSRFIYGPVQYNLFGELMTRKLQAQNETILEYLQRRVFDPAGIVVGSWTTDAQDNPQLAGGAFMTAENWLRYGQLILQQGVWEGEQVLSSERLAECFVNSETNPAYGLTFWLHDEGGIEGAAPRPSLVLSDSTPDTYVAAGAGIQRLYIIPSLDLVVVRFGALRGRDVDPGSRGGGGRGFSDAEFIDLLLGL